ncbi:MAG: tRNA (adenosine(37)-N6)-threonylcarbamoyltransferase complex transferase subunit TsaD [Candidatus Omnitrophica bacterium]|nr:tRNA (adenosine(37)-N6)-threonylcarbamoyltransferase complex transferase subunit TsaD [Candidatus Omnitrophota bacterium]
MLILGIETSCDETALALVENGRWIRGTQMVSSIASHQRFGGVVPEIASRAHVELFTCELETLLSDAGVSGRDIDRIAVTCGPGLPGSLLAGVIAAKSLGWIWKKPVVRVNHLHAHLYAAVMGLPQWPLDEPMVGLVISGGHTALVQMKGMSRFSLLGQTRDDAVGEAFDKVAKLLGLGFPGGPEIEKTARLGNDRAYRFSVPKIKGGSDYDFSFSGIKTAVLYTVQRPSPERGVSGPKLPAAQSLKPELVADLAASFQRAVVDEVVMKSVKACRSLRVSRLVVGGGVIANRPLRERLKEVCGDSKIEVAIPPMGLCTDNGAMIAGLGFLLDPATAAELTAVPDLAMGMN